MTYIYRFLDWLDHIDTHVFPLTLVPIILIIIACLIGIAT